MQFGYCSGAAGGSEGPPGRQCQAHGFGSREIPAVLHEPDARAPADAPEGTQYLNALYWAFTTMTTIGYGARRGEHTADTIIKILSLLTWLWQSQAQVRYNYFCSRQISPALL